MGHAVRLLIVAMCFAMFGCTPPGTPATTPAAVTTRDPGDVACPNGKPARAGLANFGAYIGTWQESRPHDRTVSEDYVIGMIPGHVGVRCSDDGFVIHEEINPMFESPAGQALRVALTDIPQDSEKVYDHLHAGCRVFQYTSQTLARQLRADDNDGRVDIVFESEAGAYNSGAVRVILLDLYDRLGADTRDC